MPELPDITIYLEALESRIVGQSLKHAQILSPFLLRTAVPPIQRLQGLRIISVRRVGKRIALEFEERLWLVLHLMIAGRLHWVPSLADSPQAISNQNQGPNPKRHRKPAKFSNKQAVFDFESGALLFTEAGTKRRASLHLVQGETGLQALSPGGVEVLDCSLANFSDALLNENHTLKRALTDPRLFSGIGNAYSDEILHCSRLSPVKLTRKLSPDEIKRLYEGTQKTLKAWVERLRNENGNGFPENVTAFRPEMAVHGKFGQPCPVCGEKIQRIRYANNETNYCPGCQTNGKLLADRSLSLLLKQDWPRTPEELEEMRTGARSN